MTSAYLQNLVSNSEEGPADLSNFDSVYLFKEKKKDQDEKCVLSPLRKRNTLALVLSLQMGDKTPQLRTARSYTGDCAYSQGKQQSDFFMVVFNKQNWR